MHYSALLSYVDAVEWVTDIRYSGEWTLTLNAFLDYFPEGLNKYDTVSVQSYELFLDPDVYNDIEVQAVVPFTDNDGIEHVTIEFMSYF